MLFITGSSDVNLMYRRLKMTYIDVESSILENLSCNKDDSHTTEDSEGKSVLY